MDAELSARVQAAPNGGAEFQELVPAIVAGLSDLQFTLTNFSELRREPCGPRPVWKL